MYLTFIKVNFEFTEGEGRESTKQVDQQKNVHILAQCNTSSTAHART